MTWRRLAPEDRGEWSALLDQAEDATLFQTAEWAEFKRTAGWSAERWLAEEAGQPRAGLQVLLKRLPLGRLLAWAPGGPLTGLQTADPTDARQMLASWLGDFAARGGVYARFRSHRPASPDWIGALHGVLARPKHRINSGVSLRFDLSKPAAELRRGFSSKHRYYVKAAEAAGLEWAWGKDAALAAQMRALYAEMAAAKALGARLFAPDSIPRLMELFGERALVLVGRLKGAPVTGCLTLKTGRGAFYLMAATSAEGRKVSAAYALVPRLLEVLREQGARALDFGGVDPGNERARGVDHFKKGFGAEPLEYLGEWDWGRWPWLRRAAGLAIAYRGMGG